MAAQNGRCPVLSEHSEEGLDDEIVRRQGISCAPAGLPCSPLLLPGLVLLAEAEGASTPDRYARAPFPLDASRVTEDQMAHPDSWMECNAIWVKIASCHGITILDRPQGSESECRHFWPESAKRECSHGRFSRGAATRPFPRDVLSESDPCLGQHAALGTPAILARWARQHPDRMVVTWGCKPKPSKFLIPLASPARTDLGRIPTPDSPENGSFRECLWGLISQISISWTIDGRRPSIIFGKVG